MRDLMELWHTIVHVGHILALAIYKLFTLLERWVLA